MRESGWLVNEQPCSRVQCCHDKPGDGAAPGRYLSNTEIKCQLGTFHSDVISVSDLEEFYRWGFWARASKSITLSVSRTLSCGLCIQSLDRRESIVRTSGCWDTGNTGHALRRFGKVWQASFVGRRASLPWNSKSDQRRSLRLIIHPDLFFENISVHWRAKIS